MRRLLLPLLLFSFSSVMAQTYVWKNGHPLIEDPDSITFVKPDMSLQVCDSADKGVHFDYVFTYPTTDYDGKPCVMSAVLYLTPAQIKTKQISKMALFHRYTIFASADAPSALQLFDLQAIGLNKGMAVVAADYEGFGATGDRLQAYCFAESNARTAIDALLAARTWLTEQGYTIGDSILNYGYSQGGQTAMAALKLAQTEYRDRIRFTKTIAGAGPYDLRVTYYKFLDWKKIGQPMVLPLTLITFNELFNLGLKYKDVFIGKLASNVKSWFISKKFDRSELQELMGVDSVHLYMKPQYCDSTSEEMKRLLLYVDRMRITDDWNPDADTEVKLYHSLKDDIVAPENSRNMYNWLVSKGVQNVAIDTTTINITHTAGGAVFLLSVLMNDLNNW